MINKEIQQTISSVEKKCPIEKWEIIKKRIKKVTLRYAKERIGEDRIIIGNL